MIFTRCFGYDSFHFNIFYIISLRKICIAVIYCFCPLLVFKKFLI